MQTITKAGQNIEIETIKNDRCVYGGRGFPDCHCNDCINEIVKYAEFQKNKEYLFKGRIVEITSFCPLESCCDVFIQNKPNTGFCEWLTLEEARKVLTEVNN